MLNAPIYFGHLRVLSVPFALPEISIRLILTDRNVDLLEDRIDMAVRIGPPSDSALVATKIGAMRTVVTASPALLSGWQEPQSPKDLPNYPCITLDLPMPSSGWRFTLTGSRRGIDVPVSHACRSPPQRPPCKKRPLMAWVSCGPFLLPGGRSGAGRRAKAYPARV